MIRQLGRPTMFFSLSASESMWSDLLKILYRSRYNQKYTTENVITDMKI